jgi:hypothetical protein
VSSAKSAPDALKVLFFHLIVVGIEITAYIDDNALGLSSWQAGA